jgi:deoxyadenosine/deoxycytidine kinase
MTKIYFVEGNIGTGKSTFLSMIQKVYGDKYQVIYEPVDVWTNFKDNSGKNILQYFYEDPKRFAYTFQNTAFVSRVEKLQEIDYSKDAVFIERSIWSDKNIFAKNCFETDMMSEIEYLLYQKWFLWLEKNLTIGNYEFVYLKCPPEISYSRMKTRCRNEESGVSLDYIKQIHNQHEIWMRDVVKTKNMITLNAEADFKDENVFKEFFTFVIE